MEWLSNLGPYHWLALGLILLAARALGAASLLPGAGIAALATGLVAFVAPELASSLQIALFAIGTVLMSYLYLQVFPQAREDAGDSLIN
jgi:membrane protein implicated in regulation of membrane protease activity